MKKTLVIFAHPYLEYSSLNTELIKVYDKFEHITFKDLYEEYPDFHIATFRERKRIKDYERLIFHFPLIWFGLPPLLKLWIDEVFDMNWITDEDHPLKNKDAIIITTVGGKEESYEPEGIYGCSVSNLLNALNISLKVIGVEVKQTKIIYNADELNKDQKHNIGESLKELLEMP